MNLVLYHRRVVCTGVLLICAFTVAKAGSNAVLNETDKPTSPASRGGEIAFVASRDGSENVDVYVMGSNGTQRRRLTSDPAFDGSSSFSPDGHKITFVSTRDKNAEIYSIKVDGTGLTRLTSNLAWDGTPAFIAQGRKIAFVSNRGGNSNVYRIYTVNADGTNLTKLAKTPAKAEDLTFSPDGRKTTFWVAGVSLDNPSNYIYTMNLDGTKVRRITKGVEPTFSPDSRRIVFHNFGAIYVMNADGTGLHRLSPPGRPRDRSASFSPDGHKIVFVSQDAQRNIRSIKQEVPLSTKVNKNSDIYVMNVNGTGVSRLTNSSIDKMDKEDPIWGTSP